MMVSTDDNGGPLQSTEMVKCVEMNQVEESTEGEVLMPLHVANTAAAIYPVMIFSPPNQHIPIAQVSTDHILHVRKVPAKMCQL